MGSKNRGRGKEKPAGKKKNMAVRQVLQARQLGLFNRAIIGGEYRIMPDNINMWYPVYGEANGIRTLEMVRVWFQGGATFSPLEGPAAHEFMLAVNDRRYLAMLEEQAAQRDSIETDADNRPTERGTIPLAGATL